MRKARSGFETKIFGAAAAALLVFAGAAALLQPHLHLHNARLQYGMAHLAGALLASFLFTAAVALAWPTLARGDHSRWLNRSSAQYLLLITAIFCLFWLPPLLAGHFDEDDWQLLAAAAIRKVLYLHPGWSWYALDSVDGNFRPLGTVLYFGYLYKLFRLWPLPYLLGLFVVNLLGSLLAFFIVRQMGYAKLAATAATLLYISRSMTYEIRTWPSALGDALVILLCGVMALALLKAIQQRGPAVWGWHVLAWAAFFLATLAKQSAFAAPLIVALLLLLRPGLAHPGPWPRRLRSAALGLAIYGATAAVTFFHAKFLTRAESPYPIAFSPAALLRTFSYAVWYLGTVELPSKHLTWLWIVPSLLGLGVVVAAVVALCRRPGLLGERPRDVLFCLGAAAASVSLFVVLANRQASYYGAMAAFWLSIALGIVLTRPAMPPPATPHPPPAHSSPPQRLACFLFCALLVTGFLDVRLKQTGLFPSGGYTWGTFTGSFAESMYQGIARQLAAAPDARILVLVDMPGNPSHNTCMALLADPQLRSILTYDSQTHRFFANDLAGARPADTFAALNDVHSYNWTVPLPEPEATSILHQSQVLWLKFEEGKIVVRN